MADLEVTFQSQEGGLKTVGKGVRGEEVVRCTVHWDPTAQYSVPYLKSMLVCLTITSTEARLIFSQVQCLELCVHHKTLQLHICQKQAVAQMGRVLQELVAL